MAHAIRALLVACMVVTAGGCLVEFPPLESRDAAAPADGGGADSGVDSGIDAGIDAGVRDAGSCVCPTPDGCLADGALSAADFCLQCLSGQLVSVCEAAPGAHDAFDDFSRGALGRSAGNLYIARDDTSGDGSVRIVHTTDFDGDGALDIIVPDYHAGGFQWLAGGLTGPPTHVPGPQTDALAMADVDRDGVAELVYTGWATEVVGVCDAAACGEFAAPGAADVAIADLDADGYLDLVVAGSTIEREETQVLWGTAQGFGGSTTRIVAPGEQRSRGGLAIADLDGDGRLDLVVGYYRQIVDTTVRDHSLGQACRYLGEAGRAFSAGSCVDVPGLIDLSVADLDADGELDLVATSFLSGTEPPYDFTSARVFMGTGAGWVTSVSLGIDSTYAVSVADLDGGAGWLDIVMSVFGADAAGDPGDAQSVIVHPTGAGAFPRERFDTHGATSVWVADVTGDGAPDALVSEFRPFLPPDPPTQLRLVPNGDTSAASSVDMPGARLGRTHDLGHLWDRGSAEVFVGEAILTSAQPLRLAWDAQLPHGSRLEMEVQTAVDVGSLGDDFVPLEAQRGPAEGSYYAVIDAAADHRAVRYRATFHTPGFVSLPRLESVSVFQASERP